MRAADAMPRQRPGLRVVALLHDVGKPTVGASASSSFPGHAEAGAALAHGVLRRLKFPNRTVDRALHLIAQHSELPGPDCGGAELRRWLRRVGRAYVWDLLRLRIADARAHDRVDAGEVSTIVALRRRARRELSARVPLEVADLAIGGAELRELGIPAGPRYGPILQELLERVIENPEQNERELLMDHARTLIDG
jgi:tRNA nucleotidyltransferase (CCA-adding enzyme)